MDALERQLGWIFYPGRRPEPVLAFSGLFSEDMWVNFKVFGLMGLLILFVIGQSIWLGKHIEHDQKES